MSDNNIRASSDTGKESGKEDDVMSSRGKPDAEQCLERSMFISLYSFSPCLVYIRLYYEQYDSFGRYSVQSSSSS